MHQANGSGLQQHSIGDDYPYTVVGTIDNPDEGYWATMYYVQNLENGKRDERTFFSSHLAHVWCRHLRELGALS